MRRVTLVVNPSAGHGRGRRLLEPVAARLAAAGLAVEARTSNDFHHCLRLCREAVAAGDDALVVVGGDGMVHAGLNACARTDVPLGIIPAGTGNDFARSVGVPHRWQAAADAIIAGEARKIDLMAAEGDLDEGPSAYIGSALSTGFDEKVAARAASLPLHLAAPSYAFAVFAELRRFGPLRYRLTQDGVTRELDAILVVVANAGIIGGGIRIAPDVDLDDGLLDVTVVHPVGRATLFRLFPRLYTGTFVRHPAIERFRTPRITVDGPDLRGSADGEPFGRVPITCTAVPRGLQVLVPREPR